MSKESSRWDQAKKQDDIDKSSKSDEAKSKTDARQPETEEAKEGPLASPEALDEDSAQMKLLREQLLRATAEADNIQKRAEKKISDAQKYAIQDFAKELLPVIDVFDRALLEHASEAGPLRDGIQRTHELFLSVFAKFGLKAIDPLGEDFNPEQHEAISTMPSEDPAKANKVMQVLQKGYSLNDRLIRPALVIVAKS